jgi:hypothetical protein
VIISAIELNDATDWPSSGGTFVLIPRGEIQTRYVTTSEDTQSSLLFNGRYDHNQKYTYNSKTGNTIEGIQPDLPDLSQLYEFAITSAERLASHETTITVSTEHNLVVGDSFTVSNSDTDGISNFDGTFEVTEVISSFVFKCLQPGDAANATTGTVRYEKSGMSNGGSLVVMTSAQLSTGIIGPYIWDSGASFVISSMTAQIQEQIFAGNNVRTLNVNAGNNILDEEGFVIFDFGTENEEGPVRMLYKPTDNSVQLDPSYVFQFNHSVNSSITVIRRRGAHILDGLGGEYAPYITDPATARTILQDLIREVKSVGIFLEYIIRYPENLYGVLDIYRSGDESLIPVEDQIDLL